MIEVLMKDGNDSIRATSPHHLLLFRIYAEINFIENKHRLACEGVLHT